jgi:hypothetical protein
MLQASAWNINWKTSCKHQSGISKENRAQASVWNINWKTGRRQAAVWNVWVTQAVLWSVLCSELLSLARNMCDCQCTDTYSLCVRPGFISACFTLYNLLCSYLVFYISCFFVLYVILYFLAFPFLLKLGSQCFVNGILRYFEQDVVAMHFMVFSVRIWRFPRSFAHFWTIFHCRI